MKLTVTYMFLDGTTKQISYPAEKYTGDVEKLNCGTLPWVLSPGDYLELYKNPLWKIPDNCKLITFVLDCEG